MEEKARYAVRDVDDLKRKLAEYEEAERKLTDSRRTLYVLMSNLPGMAYRCRNDDHWTMEFVSYGSVELTGYNPGDLIANRKAAFGDLIAPEDRQRVWEAVQKALEERKSFQIEYRIRTASGDEKWVWEKGRGVFDETDGLNALEGFVSDITERRELEEKLKDQVDWLERLNKLMAGRELRMAEMKDEILRLREKVKELEQEAG